MPRGDPNEGGPAPDDDLVAYFSWYAGGFRVFDISDPANPAELRPLHRRRRQQLLGRRPSGRPERRPDRARKRPGLRPVHLPIHRFAALLTAPDRTPLEPASGASRVAHPPARPPAPPHDKDSGGISARGVPGPVQAGHHNPDPSTPSSPRRRSEKAPCGSSDTPLGDRNQRVARGGSSDVPAPALCSALSSARSAQPL